MFDVYLELGDDGWVCAWVLELPGCFWHAPSQAAALQSAPQAIEEYLDWLHRHGETPPFPEQRAEVRLAEVQRVPMSLATRGTGGFFTPDRIPANESDMRRALQLMGYSRTDLLSLFQNMPQEVWGWSVPGSSPSWTIRTITRHVANVELYYCLRLASELPSPELQILSNDPKGLLEFLQRARDLARRFLMELTPEQRATTVIPTWAPGRWAEEQWTARKVLRRFIYHERHHTRDISAILQEWWQTH
jgi:uncharacterized damage-inducible protein DinB/predicted RNase H-like HicB family nuclease